MHTDADKNLDDAKRETRIAIERLRSIVENECWGVDDLNVETKERLRKALKKLRRAYELMV